MNSVTILRRPNTSKSRIPVAVKNQKSSNVKNTETNFKNPVSKVQASQSYKTTDHCLLQNKSSLQTVPSDKKPYDKSTKDSKFKKYIQSSFRTNEKSNNNKKDRKQSLLKCNIKSGSTKGKGLSESTSVKSSSIRGKDSSSLKVHVKSDDRTEKHLLLKTKANYGRSKQNNLLSLKTNLQSGDNKKENLSTLKTAVKPDDNSPEKLSTPKSMSEKENKVSSKPSWFTAQKDIKFEPNEMCRKMILRERELSPSICNLMPGLRLSSIQSQRPSIYNQSFELPPDPLKEVMRAIQNGLSVKKDQKSEILYKLPCSPFKDRGSFYTPCADPKREVMESLKKMKLKQQQKSSKKVTFDLNIKEWTPKGTCDTELKSFQTSDCNLSQINEKSEENTPNSPQNQGTEVSTAKQDQFNTTISELKKNDKDFINYKEVKSTEKNDDTKEEMCQSSTFSTPVIKSLPVTLTKDVTPRDFSPIQSKKFECNTLQKTDPWSSNFANNHRQIIDETSIKQRAVNFQTLESTNINDEKIETSLSKVYTPRPLSIFSQSKLMNSCSPDEFLVNRASETLLKFAPIRTPLVLKSVSKSTMLSPVVDLSPVRLKLDFSEKDTPKKEISKIHTHFKCKNITTAQNMLDELADQECCLFLSNDSIPVVCGRYITNPVALTLSEGDEMHFIPIHC